MSYDWTTHKPNGHVDRSINFGSTSLHYLLEAMRDHQLLDEQTPMPTRPDEPTPESEWRGLSGTRSPNPLQILAFKLRDQNAWLITAEECYLLVHRLGRVQEPHIKRLVDFVRFAVSKGGSVLKKSVRRFSTLCILFATSLYKSEKHELFLWSKRETLCL